MEGMFLESVPVMGSLVLAGLLLAIAVAAVVYGHLCEKAPRATEAREPLKKAA